MAVRQKDLSLQVTAGAIVPWDTPGTRAKRRSNARSNARPAASQLDPLPAAIVRVLALSVGLESRVATQLVAR